MDQVMAWYSEQATAIAWAMHDPVNKHRHHHAQVSWLRCQIALLKNKEIMHYFVPSLKKLRGRYVGILPHLIIALNNTEKLTKYTHHVSVNHTRYHRQQPKNL